MKELGSIVIRVDPCEWAQGHVRCVIHTVLGDGMEPGAHRVDKTTFPRHDFIPLFEQAMKEIARRIKAHLAETEKDTKP